MEGERVSGVGQGVFHQGKVHHRAARGAANHAAVGQSAADPGAAHGPVVKTILPLDGGCLVLELRNGMKDHHAPEFFRPVVGIGTGHDFRDSKQADGMAHLLVLAPPYEFGQVVNQMPEQSVAFLHKAHLRKAILRGKLLFRKELFFRGEMEFSILIHQHFQKLFHDILCVSRAATVSPHCSQ